MGCADIFNLELHVVDFYRSNRRMDGFPARILELARDQRALLGT